MRSLADFEFNKVPLCDGMILISEMIRDDFTSQYVYAELENLVSPAREEINQARPQDWQLEKLIELFYGEWGFCDTRGVYRLSDALWLDPVLKNRQGSAVALGAILLWVAHELEIPLVPVIFPTQMILRAEWLDGEMWLINPFNGDTLDEHTLDVWLKGNISPIAELFNEDLDEADNAEVIRKLLGYAEVCADGRASDGAGPARKRSAVAVQSGRSVRNPRPRPDLCAARLRARGAE